MVIQESNSRELIKTASSSTLMKIHQQSELKLFGFMIPLDNDDEKRKMKYPRYVAPNPQKLPILYSDFVLVKGADKESVQLILRKRLTATDMNPNHNRLSLPRKMIEKCFLRPEEEQFIQMDVESGNKKRKNKLTVMVVDLFTISTAPFEMRSMKITKWNYDESAEKKKKINSWLVALTNDWIKFVQENRLSAGDAIQIWSFRLHGDLGLIIHKVY